ncbi:MULTISPECIES: hypothetical protein [Pseudomonadati]|uniref:hypothetical protein n=1 Tax=unclassified Halobacteriovorax TaxID=2639665 RepID=UPI000CD27917|nr:hypothetical protein [Halobacteriovorax sp. DA5]POB14604.1 hypothetical protein C0Z22_05780 [Halobacteriovorax sp. DA5]
MKKLALTLSLLLATQTFAFNCKNELARDIQIRTKSTSYLPSKIPGEMIKECFSKQKNLKENLIYCGFAAYIPGSIIGVAIGAGLPILAPIFAGIVLVMENGNKDKNGISGIDHKRQLKLSSRLYSVLSGNTRDLWLIKNYLPAYKHVSNEDLMSILTKMDEDGSLCNEQGFRDRVHKISEAGLRELERKSVEVGVKLNWMDLLTIDGVDSVLTQEYKEWFLYRYTYFDYTTFGQVIDKKKLKKALKEEFKDLGYRPRHQGHSNR